MRGGALLVDRLLRHLVRVLSILGQLLRGDCLYYFHAFLASQNLWGVTEQEERWLVGEYNSSEETIILMLR